VEFGGPPVEVVMDSAAWAINRTSVGVESRSDYEELVAAAEECGAHWFKPRKCKKGDAFALRLKRALAKHQIRVADTLRWWKWEAERWVYEREGEGARASERPTPEAPAKKFNHLMDCSRYLLNELTFDTANSVLTEDFGPQSHVSRVELEYDPKEPFVCGWSFDPVPAWILGQLNRDGVFSVLSAEVGQVGDGVYAFGKRVVDLLTRMGLSEAAIHHFARPSYCGYGASRTLHTDAYRILAHGIEHVTGYDEITSEALNGHRPGLGILLLPSEERRETRDELVKGRLSLLVKGRPALVVDPTCSAVIEALSGGYCWKVNAAGLLQNDIEPNAHSAVVEALGCALAGLFAAAPVDPHEDEWRIPARGTAGGVGRRRDDY
jgi:hypothetical protein